MKFLLLVITIINIWLFVQTEDTPSPIQKQCQNETGLTDNDLKNAGTDQFKDWEKLKEFGVCMGKKSDLIDEEGDFNTDLIKDRLKKSGYTEEMIRKIQECAVRKESLTESVAQFVKCLMKLLNDRYEGHKLVETVTLKE